MPRTPLKIIAVGNSFYGDDGIGETILEALGDIPELADVPLISGSTDALGLIDHFSDTDHVVIIDAAEMGKEPGTVVAFSATEANLIIRKDHISLHGISIAYALELARQIHQLPEKITIIGIEPEHLKINTGLSRPVRDAIPEVLSKILSLYQDQMELR